MVQEAFAIIEEDLGAPLEKIFSEISAFPVAAASLGQVYRATLRDTKEEVAIKVSTFFMWQAGKDADNDWEDE